MFKKFAAAASIAACCAVFAGVSPALAGVEPPPAPTALPATVTEALSTDGFSFQIEYTLTNNDDAESPLFPQGVMAFAIDFGVPNGFFEPFLTCDSPSGWTCDFYNQSSWDGGTEIAGLPDLFTTDLIFGEATSFAEFFGPDAVNVVLFSNFESAFNIGPGESLGGFFVIGDEPLILESTAVVLCEDNNNVCATVQATGVPEPGTLALVGIGLIGLGAVRYRRAA
jgi:hypothetical protein